MSAGTVVALPVRQRQMTYRALLDDTLQMLRLLTPTVPQDVVAIDAQIAAIEETLSGES